MKTTPSQLLAGPAPATLPNRGESTDHHQTASERNQNRNRNQNQGPACAAAAATTTRLGLGLIIVSCCLAVCVQSLAPAPAGQSSSSSARNASAKLAIAPAATTTTTTTTTQVNKLDTIKVNFTDCGAKNIKEVRITPCPGDGSVCNINLGTNVTVEADFIAKHEASSLNEIIKGVIRGRELQFPEQRADPCKSTISPSCPIRLGKLYQYKAVFEVKAHYPAIPVKVRYALANASGDIVACVQISAKIVDPSPVRSSRTKPKKKPAA